MDAINTVKLMAVDFTGLAKDALHIYVSVAILLASCAVMRWKVWQWKPLALVLTAALIGEAFDLRHNWTSEHRLFFMASVHDIWNTMLVPLIIAAFARFSGVFARGDNSAGSGDQPEV